MNDAPTHVLAQSGDDRTLCGMRRRYGRWTVPLIAADMVALHRARYDLTICPQCAAVMEPAS